MARETNSFSRDLGYLDGFLDKLEAHAGDVGGAAGARLAALMVEERTRWQEIKALLGGGAPVVTASDTPAAVSATGFTVGSLVSRRG